MNDGKLLYPMLGSGAFFGLFWLGYALAHQVGLHPITGLVLGFVTGCAGVTLVTQLERLDPEQ